MLKKTIVLLLAFALVLALTPPLAANPASDAGLAGGPTAALVSTAQTLWQWIVESVTSPDESEEAAESLEGDDEDDPPIANGFPGYEPVG